MAQVFPFQPYRYAPKAGDLNLLVTQPYDKISPSMQARYLSLSPHNLVRVLLGERFPSDSDTNNVYTRAAGHLEEWIKDGILVRESQPCLYAYSQEFRVPDTGEQLTRMGFIGLGAVEEYSAGVVHRHEQTLSGPKKDRLELLRKTQAHFGQLFMLYPDPEGAIDRLLAEAAASEPDAVVTDDYQAIHRVWKISDPARIAEIRKRMSDKKLLIADGHHRYETALAFKKENPGLADAGKVMMTFVNMHSSGLQILATHRLVSGLARLNAKEFLGKAKELFRVSALDSLDALRGAWAEPHADRIRIGVAFQGEDGLHLLEGDRDGRLDVPVVHDVLLDRLLGISPEAVREEKNLRYIRGADVALEQVRQGSAQAAFLLEPTTVEQVAEVSFSGGVMPQKSTDFYPKLLSGLAIYKLEN